MRPIDADELRDAIKDNYDNDVIYDFLDFVDLAPTIDAEPVVRCKDCKHFIRYEERPMCARTAVKGYGEYYGLRAVEEAHYCSYGAKMDEEVK